MPKLSTHDAKEIENAKIFLQDLKVFKEWMGSLTPLDRDNFKALVNLPNAKDLLEKCPDETVKEMGWFALHVLNLQRDCKANSKLAQSLSIGQKVSYVKSQGQTRNHHCHWPGCTRQVPPACWGCKEHWRKLPKKLRDEIWAAYAPGQEVKGTPSKEYIEVARRVQQWIKENSDAS